MIFRVSPSRVSGEIRVPGSKSHTIRGLTFALLGEGRSVLESPLDSSDTRSCLAMVQQFGAGVTVGHDRWTVEGTGGPRVPDNVIDIGNSGTSLYIGLGTASLADGMTVFTGDSQIRNRPVDPLVKAINDLGGRAFSTRKNGRPPVVVEGPIRGGETSVEAVTSQYLTSLLMACPLAREETRVRVPLLNEKPYVTMTLAWLEKLGVTVENRDYREFIVPGGQGYPSFTEAIPADFSSASFFLVAAAVAGGEVMLRGLDFSDTQGDKEVVNILKEMGARVDIYERSITVSGGGLAGGVFDLNAIPDALPALAVAACFAEGETRLENVPQARVKETDRISVMCSELTRMGGQVEELDDGLVVRGSKLRGTGVMGHGDHRVVMALAVAGLAAEGDTMIDTAESAAVTFPDFRELMVSLGADINEEE